MRNKTRKKKSKGQQKRPPKHNGKLPKHNGKLPKHNGKLPKHNGKPQKAEFARKEEQMQAAERAKRHRQKQRELDLAAAAVDAWEIEFRASDACGVSGGVSFLNARSGVV